MTAPGPPGWLTVRRGEAPLIVSLPHAGLDLPDALVPRLVSPWLARKDADWWIDRLYAFAGALDATAIRTSWSRTLIDVNRDPDGVSLYPGLATTGLCPLTTFDGEALYVKGQEPDDAEIGERRRQAFDPYHEALSSEIARLARRHPRIVVYDAHSIRSVIPRLFDGLLPQLNVGTHDGASCDARLVRRVERACAESGLTRVVNGRFRGGYITRHYGRPQAGVHAIQMELACRAYLREPVGRVTEATWPADFDEGEAAPLQTVLQRVLRACLAFAQEE
jgi:N-formylglutamate deformylase